MLRVFAREGVSLNLEEDVQQVDLQYVKKRTRVGLRRYGKRILNLIIRKDLKNMVFVLVFAWEATEEEIEDVVKQLQGAANLRNIECFCVVLDKSKFKDRAAWLVSLQGTIRGLLTQWFKSQNPYTSIEFRGNVEELLGKKLDF